MSRIIIISKGDRNPTLTDTLNKSDGTVQVMTGNTIRFRMRPVNSDVLKVDSLATVTNALAGKVAYSWSSGDTDTEGEYRAWWTVVFGDATTQDTPEFKLIVDSHSAGTGVSTGEIANQVSQLLPVTWNALSGDNRYGDSMLQARIDTLKYRLFATVVDPKLEATIYNPLVMDYVSKRAALQIIPAGIEYWMEQHTSQSTQGTQESVSYPDRIRALAQLGSWLTQEVKDILPELEGTFVVRRKANYPKVSDTGPFKSDDPARFPKPHGLGWGWDIDSVSTLPWAGWGPWT